MTQAGSHDQRGNTETPARQNDKRRHPRVAASFPLHMHCHKSIALVGEVVNISVGGLLLRTDILIEPETVAEAAFWLVNRSTEVKCDLKVAVAWCEVCNVPDCYWVGCRIVDIPFSTKVWLEQFIAGRLTSAP